MLTAILLSSLTTAKPELPPSFRKHEDKVEDSSPTYHRHGLTLRFGLGLASCTGYYCKNSDWDYCRSEGWDYCNDTEFKVNTGFGAHFEIGARPIKYLSLGFRFAYMRMLIEMDQGEGFSTIITPGVFAYAHPVPRSRVDPYLGLGFGYVKHTDKFESDIDDEDLSIIMKRGYVSATLGLDIFVSEHFAIGPRFDYYFPFSGSYYDDGERYTVEELDEEFSDELPQPFSFTLNASAYFF